MKFALLILLCLPIFIGCDSNQMKLFHDIRKNDFSSFSKNLIIENIDKPVYPAGPDNPTFLINCACTYGRPDFVKLLIENGADTGKTDFTGSNCVFCALGNGDHLVVLPILEMLNSENPNLFSKAETGESATEYARSLRLDEKILTFLDSKEKGDAADAAQ